MFVRRLDKGIAAAVALFFFLLLPSAGCTLQLTEQTERNPAQPSVVVTLSFFEDMVRRVAGEKMPVKALVPVGVEPEEYDPLPDDIRKINDATAFFYNGLNMERWLPRVVPRLEQQDNCFALAEHSAITTIPIPAGPFAGQPDPHAWTDINNATLYVEQIAAVLEEIDPSNGKYYREQAARYRGELQKLDIWILEKVNEIPPEQRLLITSEMCFQYYARAYGFNHDAIWPINAPEEGTPAQIIRIIQVVRDSGVPAVFVENQVDPRPMQQVSRETGVPIGGVLYSDSLSKPGEGGETFIAMMKSNTEQIVHALLREEYR